MRLLLISLLADVCVVCRRGFNKDSTELKISCQIKGFRDKRTLDLLWIRALQEEMLQRFWLVFAQNILAWVKVHRRISNLTFIHSIWSIIKYCPNKDFTLFRFGASTKWIFGDLTEKIQLVVRDHCTISVSYVDIGGVQAAETKSQSTIPLFNQYPQLTARKKNSRLHLVETKLFLNINELDVKGACC